MSVPNLCVLFIGLSISRVVPLQIGTPELSQRISFCLESYATSLHHETWARELRLHPLSSATTSNRSVIIGGGMGTTGTTSLHSAFKLLGYDVWHAGFNSTWDERRLKVIHMLKAGKRSELRKFDFVGLLDGADGAIDSPTAEVFIDLFLSFPNAKVVLSTRPSKAWVASRLKHHYGTPFPKQEPFRQSLNRATKRFAERMYDLNNDFVRCVVPKEQLLEFDLWKDSAERIHGLMKELNTFGGRTGEIALSFPKSKDNIHVVDIDTGEACEAGSENLTDQIDVTNFGTFMQEQAQRNCEILID